MKPDSLDNDSGSTGTPDTTGETSEGVEAEADFPAEAPESERIPVAPPKPTPLYRLLSKWLLASEAWLRSRGGTGLRRGLQLFWALVALAGIVLLVGPVINKPLSLDDITGSASSATERWIARDFDVDYRISRAPDGTLRAEVEERISATFTEKTDEQGITRVLATQYQGHALRPGNVEATLDGAAITVGRAETANQLTLTLAGTERLQGDHEFVLRYELQDLAYPATDEASGQQVDLLEWDVFGPSWPQAFAGLDVQVTIPKEIDDRLIRQPRGSIAWTLVGAGAWLEPEPGAGSEVSYRFTNDQNIPPHAQAWFTMSFEAGTFTMPPLTPLHWVQVFGPIVPLAFLALTLLLAQAARAVAWGDTRGRAWLIAQFEPPKGISARMAAQILRAAPALELADALANSQQKGMKDKQRRPLLVAAAKVARRTGRVGDLPRAFSRYFAAPERRAQLAEGLRRVPRGFVRDLFIAAPIALTLVQWGLVRQLSHQVILSIVWWPVVFVLASTAIALLIIWIALTARPLTRRGALAKQHLLGIGIYAGQAQLLERAETREKLLPYAVLLAPPRTAGERIVGLIEGELGMKGVSSRWRISDFLSWPRIIIRALSAVIVIAAIALVSFFPTPFPSGSNYASYWGNLPGNLWTKVHSIDAVGELSRAADGTARVDVIERLEVEFSAEGRSVPQFVQQWPSIREGQELGLEVSSLTIDGEDAPFATQSDADTLLVRTTLVTVLEGTHEVQIEYALSSAAFATEHEGTTVDRVRWAALLDGWEYNDQWGYEPVPEPIRIEFRIDDELAALSTNAGWISQDTTTGDHPRDWQPSVVPFDNATSVDGAKAHVLELVEQEHGGWPFDFTVDDVGASVDFPAGTFTDTDAGARRWAQFHQILPQLALLVLAALGIGLGLFGAAHGAARSRRAFDPGVVRDLVWWLAPAAALGAAILFVWISVEVAADHPVLPLTGWPTLAALVACCTGIALTRRSRRP